MNLNNFRTKLIIALTCIFLVVGIVVGAIFYRNSNTESLSTISTSSSVDVTGDSSVTGIVVDEFDIPSLPNNIEYEGKTYELRSDISTFLFLEINDERFSSYMFLFVLDSTNKSIRVLKIPSDIIVDVDVYNDDRELLETSPMAIGYQFSYGESYARSCHITRTLVSSVLKGARVDYCFSITQDGLCTVVDSLEGGKVSVGLRNDWTDLNPAYTLDSTVELSADGVREFFEFDGMNQYDYDTEYLTRRDWFMLSLFSSIVRGSGSSDLDSVMEAADGMYEADMDVDMLEQYRDYEMIGSMVIPYDLSDSRLDQILIDLFYQEV